MFVYGHYPFREANSFLSAKLEGNCEPFLFNNSALSFLLKIASLTVSYKTECYDTDSISKALFLVYLVSCPFSRSRGREFLHRSDHGS